MAPRSPEPLNVKVFFVDGELISALDTQAPQCGAGAHFPTSESRSWGRGVSQVKSCSQELTQKSLYHSQGHSTNTPLWSAAPEGLPLESSAEVGVVTPTSEAGTLRLRDALQLGQGCLSTPATGVARLRWSRPERGGVRAGVQPSSGSSLAKRTYKRTCSENKKAPSLHTRTSAVGGHCSEKRLTSECTLQQVTPAPLPTLAAQLGHGLVGEGWIFSGEKQHINDIVTP